MVFLHLFNRCGLFSTTGSMLNWHPCSDTSNAYLRFVSRAAYSNCFRSRTQPLQSPIVSCRGGRRGSGTRGGQRPSRPCLSHYRERAAIPRNGCSFVRFAIGISGCLWGREPSTYQYLGYLLVLCCFSAYCHQGTWVAKSVSLSLILIRPENCKSDLAHHG